MTEEDDSKKEALLREYQSKALEGETCEIHKCPHCEGLIAIYKKDRQVHTVEQPSSVN